MSKIGADMCVGMRGDVRVDVRVDMRARARMHALYVMHVSARMDAVLPR